MHGNQKQALWGYIAGIMDADGCFMIIRQQRGPSCNKKGWNLRPSHIAAVKICMIEEEAISLITHKMKFGQYHLEGARSSRPNSKRIYHWYMRERPQVMMFLKNVMPYLRVKKKRAEFLLEFCERMEKYHAENWCKRLPDSELDYRELAYKKMREFNGNNAAATTKS